MQTNGWDSISIVEVSEINRQLAANMPKLIQDFGYPGTDPLAGSYTIAGTFGSWSISGGSVTALQVEIPITRGTLTSTASTVDVSGMVAKVEVNLQFLPSKLKAHVNELRFDMQQVGKGGGPGVVLPMSCTDPKGTGVGTIVVDAIANLLVANADEVSFVFAEVGIVDPAAPSWLRPVQSRYSYQDLVAGGGSYLAIMSANDDRDVSGYSLNVGADLVSKDYPLSFIMSGDLFLQHVVLPALPRSFHHASASNFDYRDGTISLSGTFDLDGVQKGALTYTPEVTGLSISIADSALATKLSGSAGLHLPNATVSFAVGMNNALTYDPATHSISFAKDPNPSSSYEKNIPWYDYLLFGPAGAIAVAIVGIVMNVLPGEIADSVSQGIGGSTIAATPAATVAWPGLQSLHVQAAGLDDAFYIRAVAA